MTTDLPRYGAPATTNEAATVRTPPRLVRVPPPRTWQSPAVPVVLVGVFAVIGVIVFKVAPSPFDWIGAAFFVVLAVLAPLSAWRENARSNRERVAMIGAHPEIEADALVAAVATRWRQGASFPKPEEIATTVRQAADASVPAGATVVCLGAMDVPEIGEMRFEPYIITATELLWRRLVILPIAGALVALWVLQYTHVLRWRVTNFGGFGYPLVMGVAAAVTWVWRGLIHPTYVRMAPGIVEVLEYRLGRRKPIIRSYPLDGGTVVVVFARKVVINVTLLRSDQKDVLPLAQMRHKREALEHIWRALLSTAPIPRLSDEELIE